MDASKQRPVGAKGAASTAAAASSSSSSSALSSLSSAPPIAGLSSSDAAEIADLQKRGQFVFAAELISGLIKSQADVCSTPPPLALISIRADCYFRLDEYNAALDDCDTILSLKPRDVEANSLQFKCLLGLRRYDEAASEICILNKRDKANGIQHYKPLTKLWSRIQLERAGTFEVAAMMNEAVSLVTPFSETGDDDSDDGDDDDGDDDGSSDCDLSELYQQMARPCVRLGPHADYLHPSVECAVAIAGKGRGTRVRANATSAADSSVFSSSSSSSSSAASSSAASASASSTASGSLPKHSLVMSMKAIAVNLNSDALGDKAMLLRKLNDQPHLIAQVTRLFGLEQHEADRAELLRTEGAEAVWKHAATSPSTESLANVNRTRFRLTATLSKNPFGDALSCEWRERGVGGGALFFLPSFFNHSCVPNCHWTLIGDQIFIRTVRDVAAGEELTISYRCSIVDCSFEYRQQTLRNWSFDCTCEFCAPYTLHSKLTEHESESRSKRCALSAEFYALPSSALTQRIAVVDSLAGLIADHAQLVSQLGANSQLLETSMRQHWGSLSSMLSAILRTMQPSDDRFAALFQRHRVACQRRALISNRWDCSLSGWMMSQVNQLSLDVQFPLHATRIAHQQSTMRQMIRQFAAHHGLPCGVHFLLKYKSDLDGSGLMKLYETCLAQIRAEEAAARAEMEDE